MNAILLCAGLSTRLRPLTTNNPKCLIKFSEINLLEFWINKLISLRVNKILINTHFKHKKIFEYINNHKFKDRINLTYEKKLLGTAGTLIKNSNFFNNNDGLLIHCDNYTDANLDFFLYNHKKRPKQCLMSMLTFKTRYPKGCGIVKYNQEDRVLVDFFEKPKKYIGSNANGIFTVYQKK